MSSNWWENPAETTTINTSDVAVVGELFPREDNADIWKSDRVGDFVELEVAGTAPEFPVRNFNSGDTELKPRIDGTIISGTRNGQPLPAGGKVIHFGNWSLERAFKKFVPEPGSTVVIVHAEDRASKKGNPAKLYKLIPKVGATNLVDQLPAPTPTPAAAASGIDWGNEDEPI